MSLTTLSKQTLSLIVFLIYNMGIKAQSPVASFTASDSLGCAPLSVSFTNSSLNAVNYEWDFGNGKRSTVAQPTVVYPDSGVYTIKLIAKNLSGNADTLIMTNAVQVNALPDIDFTLSQTSSCLNNNAINIINNASGQYTYLWDFGDGNSSTKKNPDHHYSKIGSYNIKLLAKDSIGCTSFKYSSDTIHIVSGSKSNFTVNTTKSCDKNLFFNFKDSSINAVNWIWKFGDGDSSTIANPKHQYANTGPYTVTLISTDTNGCSDTSKKVDFINIHSSPQAKFSSENILGCTPLTSSFKGDSTNNSLTHTWSFAKKDTMMGNNISLSFNENGLYDLMLTVEDTNGCKDSIIKLKYIHAKGNAIASFQSDSLDSCINRSIRFNNTSQNGKTFLWNFGDSTSSRSYHPNHTFSQEGFYTISLEVTDSMGCTDSTSMHYEIGGLKPDFIADNKKGCKPFSVDFTDKSLKADKWIWYFGDGDTSHQQNPTHIYKSGGTFDVSLKVETSSGCTDSILFSQFIEVFEDTMNSIVGDTTYGCLPLPVDLSKNRIGSSKWLWDFGNGDTSTLSNPIYTYRSSGSYTISLKTLNTNGCPIYIKDYATIVIDSITPRIKAKQFDCTALTIQLIDSTEDAISWFWDFGDGTYSTLRDPIHQYPDTLVYGVTLTITTSTGCVHSIFYPTFVDFRNCLVNGVRPPTASGLASSASPSYKIDSSTVLAQKCAPQFASFSNHVVNASSWSWGFGDGDSSNLKNPTHLYKSPGTYTVTLIAQTPLGPDTTIWFDHINVNGPEANFVTNSVDNCDSILVQFNDQSTNADSWLWQFSKNDSSNLSSPKRAFPFSNRNNMIKLRVKDSSGCSSTSLNILNFPSNGIQVEYADTACVSDSIQFTPSDTSLFSYVWDFGDGTFDSTKTPNHNYTKAGIYLIKLSTLSSNGCKKIYPLDSIEIRGVSANFSILDTIQCLGKELNLVPQDTTADSYNWSIDSIWASAELYPLTSIHSPGMHTISLITVKDGCSSSFTSPTQVEVDSLSPDVSIVQKDFCYPISIELADNNANSNLWEWKVNNSFQSSSQMTSFSTNVDSNLISLKVTSKNGCVDSLSQLFIPSVLEADFKLVDSTGCAPYAVRFNNTASNTVKFYWDFGDGHYSTRKNPTHVYKNTGHYDVKLVVESADGCRDSIVKINLVHVEDIQAKYDINYTSSCAPMIVNFTDRSSNSTSWFWDFGDGSSSNAANPFHIYNNSGKYTVTLVVGNGNGCYDTLINLDQIDVPGPIAAFTFSDSIVCGPEQIHFTDLSSNASKWIWAFGDGSTSTQQHPSHHYEKEGVYQVSLTSIDASGCKGFYTATTPITIGSLPKAEFTISDTIGCTPFQLDIKNKSTNASIWEWNLGNGITLNDSVINYSFDNPGAYSLSLYVGNSLGCKDTMTIDSIYAINTPNSKIDTVSPMCENEHAFSLNTLAQGGIWRGNGITDSLKGIFDPSLAGSGLDTIIYTINGLCFSSDTIQIEVKETPEVDFIVDKKEACKELDAKFEAVVSTEFEPKCAWKYNDITFGHTAIVEKTFSPGVYDISLEVSTKNGCSNSIIKPALIKVYDSIPSKTDLSRVSVINDSKVLIEWNKSTDIAFDRYVLFRESKTSGQFEEIDSYTDRNTDRCVDINLNTLRDSYCYKILVVDKCGQAINIDKAISHCTINVSTNKIDTHRVAVSWNPYKGCNIQKYEVYRQLTGSDNTEIITTVSGDQSSFTDTSLYCNSDYVYKIKAIGYGGLSLGSWSDTAMSNGDSVSDEQLPKIIRASVENNASVLVEWTKPMQNNDFTLGYVIHRSFDNEQFIPLTYLKSDVNQFIDNNVDVMKENYYYRIEVVNGCPDRNVISHSASSILLEPTQIDEHKGMLKWSSYEKWEKGVRSYEIQRLNEFNQWETIRIVPGDKEHTIINF